MALKQSIYNTILPLNNGHILVYNALNDKFVALRRKYDIDGLTKDPTLHPGIIEQLKGAGAIIDAKTDEISKLKDIIRSVDNDGKIFQLHVNPTVDCNFHCWYCYEEHRKGSRMSEKTFVALQGYIDTILRENKNLRCFYLSFFGGEPLICFQSVIKPLTAWLYDLCNNHNILFAVHITTNGSLIDTNVIKFFNGKDATFQITLDGHREFHNKTRFSGTIKNSYDLIIQNISKLALSKNSVQVRINYTKDNINSISQIAEDLSKIPAEAIPYIDINFQRVWQDVSKDDVERTKTIVMECASSLNNAGFVTSTHFCHSHVLGSCYGDKLNYALVNFDGSVYLCTARDFNETNRAGYLNDDGMIIWKDNAKKKRMESKFSLQCCHICRIAPLCGGGCTQQAIEHKGENSCIYGYTASDMDKIVADRFEEKFLLNQF